MAEVLIVVAILAVIAAVTIPTIMDQMRVGYANAVAGELNTLSQAIIDYRSNVGRYPAQLAYLTFLPSSGVNDPCGVAYVAANYSGWHGPYVNRNITGYYVIANDDSVANTIVRSPAAQNNAVTNYLQINIAYVDTLTALALDQQIDGVVNFAAGSILWTKTSGSGLYSKGTLTYQMPIHGC